MSEVVDESDWLVGWLEGVGWGSQDSMMERQKWGSECGLLKAERSSLVSYDHPFFPSPSLSRRQTRINIVCSLSPHFESSRMDVIISK